MTPSQFGKTGLIFIAAFVLVIALVAVLSRRAGAGKSAIEKGIIVARMHVLGFGFVVLVLFLLLPTTPVISSFGYPDNVKQLEPAKLLRLLQMHSQALVETTEVLRWFLLGFAVFFVRLIYSLSGLFQMVSPGKQEKSEIEPP